MIIAVASGKGGTGKTTVATGLALSLATIQNPPPLFLDCDVEAPNAHIYLKPDLLIQERVNTLIPQVSAGCSYCAKCAEVCQFNAIAVFGEKVTVFRQLCHGCGLCTAVCPSNAIQEVAYSIGIVEKGLSKGRIKFARGILNISEPLAVPVIRQLKSWIVPQQQETVIIDSPPGTSCPVVASNRDVDYVILVTEPTPFGLHDLKLAHQLTQEMNIPVGVILNRDGMNYPAFDAYVNREQLPLLLRIPFDRKIAEGLAKGMNLVEIYPEYEESFQHLFQKIKKASSIHHV